MDTQEREEGAASDGAKRPPEGTPSERFLFGGPLRYEEGWARHRDAFLALSVAGMLRALPGMLGSAVRLAWRADSVATSVVAAAELVQGIARAVVLVAVNSVLVVLLGSGSMETRLGAVLPTLGVVAAAALAGAAARATSTYGTGRLEPVVERVATADFLAAASRVELAAIEDDDFHRLVDSAQYGAGSARRMIKYSASMINALFSLVAAAGVLTVLHPVLLPLLVTMVLPQAWAALSIARRRYRSFHTWVQHQRAGQQFRQLLTEPAAGAEVRVHGLGGFLLGHFEKMSRSYEGEQTRLARLAARTGVVASLWTGAASLVVHLVLGWLLWDGTMALAVAGTAVIAIRTGSANLEALVVQVNYLHEEALFVADLDRLRVESARRAIPSGGLPLPRQPSDVRMEGITFGYPGSETRPALRDVSLTIPAGKVVALVGENGSGKTTLVKLLAGLYTPQSGRIFWGGVDTAEADRSSLFTQVATVNQDFYRWPFTARANIALGRPEAEPTERRLQEAAVHGGAASFIEGLPRGWDTLLVRGFRGGHQISGGMWQKIGIARARYREAQLLIVDEPTAALDARAELRVFEQIRRLADRGQTVVLITHRLASVRMADLVYVLDEGQVAESGTPDELLAEGGIYRRLYDLQAAQFASTAEQSVAEAEAVTGDVTDTHADEPEPSARATPVGGGCLAVPRQKPTGEGEVLTTASVPERGRHDHAAFERSEAAPDPSPDPTGAASHHLLGSMSPAPETSHTIRTARSSGCSERPGERGDRAEGKARTGKEHAGGEDAASPTDPRSPTSCTSPTNPESATAPQDPVLDGPATTTDRSTTLGRPTAEARGGAEPEPE
ncbi:ATP-binding cassette domain-containing protein [Streptomyces sulphureus]|uniref:ATP-binding cassette domain-containing protein n=1 Tax=Streptomyces sulphureus TaxID=47758 RepID=UPI00039D07D6